MESASQPKLSAARDVSCGVHLQGAEGQDVEAGDPSSNDPNVEPLTADMERSAAIVVKVGGFTKE